MDMVQGTELHMSVVTEPDTGLRMGKSVSAALESETDTSVQMLLLQQVPVA